MGLTEKSFLERNAEMSVFDTDNDESNKGAIECSKDARDCLIFLLALEWVSITDIAKKFSMTKSEVYEIVKRKLEEHHAGNENIKDLDTFPKWKHEIIEKELKTLWETL